MILQTANVPEAMLFDGGSADKQTSRSSRWQLLLLVVCLDYQHQHSVASWVGSLLHGNDTALPQDTQPPCHLCPPNDLPKRASCNCIAHGHDSGWHTGAFFLRPGCTPESASAKGQSAGMAIGPYCNPFAGHAAQDSSQPRNRG